MGVAEKYFFLPKPVCKPCLVSHSLPGPHVSARGEVTASGNIFPVGLEIFFSSFDSKIFFHWNQLLSLPRLDCKCNFSKNFFFKLIREGNFSTFSVKYAHFLLFCTVKNIFPPKKHFKSLVLCFQRSKGKEH